MRRFTRDDNGRISGARAGSRVVIIELCKDKHELTDGTGNYRYRPIGPDSIPGVGGRLQGITVFAALGDVSANFAAKLTASYSNNGGRTWTDFAADVAGPWIATGQSVSSEYTTLTDFGRSIRFQLQTDDAGSIEHAILTISVALRFYEEA